MLEHHVVDILATSPLADIAAEEVKECIGCDVVFTSQGHLRFKVPLSNLESLKHLRCTERLWAVIVEDSAVLSGSCSGAEDDLQALTDLVSDCRWASALTAWAHFCPGLAAPLASELAAAGVQNGSTIAEDVSALKFRLHCHRAGPSMGKQGSQHGFGSIEASKYFGGAVAEAQGWTVSLSQGSFDIDLNLEISGCSARALLRLTAQHGNASGAATPPQRINAGAFSRTALRTPIAAAMARMRHKKGGRCSGAEITLDPLCGCGTLGMEAAYSSSNVFALNGDMEMKEIARFRHNLPALSSNLHNGRVGRAGGVAWDAAHLPLRTACMDSVLTDLPWGKAVGSRELNQALYPAAMREVARVLRPGGSAVLLTKDTQLMARALNSAWAIESFVQPWGPPRMLNIGGVRAALYCLDRSAADWAAMQGLAGTGENPAHAELHEIEGLQSAIAPGQEKRKERRKLNQRAFLIRKSPEYVAESAALVSNSTNG